VIDGLKPYPKTKDSGLSWLGEVPEHWYVTPISRIGQLFKGNGGNKDDEVPSGVPCVRYGDLYTWHEFFIRSARACVPPNLVSAYTPIRYGDLLFAASGETFEDIGRSAVNLIKEDACCGGDVLLLRPKQPVNPRFLAYAADATPSRNQKASMGRGFTVVHIYASQLKRLTLALPPLPEQAAIVQFLDHADRRIRRYVRAKQKLIKLLQEEKQTIIHRAVTRGLDPNVRLKPSGVEWLGKVPEHWVVSRLGRLIDLTTGFPFKSEGFTQNDADIRLLRGVNISPGKVRWNDVVRWPSRQFSAYKAFELRAGDIVLGMDRPIIQSGIRVAVMDASDLPALLLQRVARFRPKSELRADFLVLLLAGKTFSDYLTPIFTGISVPHLSPEQIKSFCFALPSFADQQQIVEWARSKAVSIERAIERAFDEISLLREFRTRLIADVVTGKLDVREAAARLPDKAEEAEPPDETEALDEADEDSEGNGHAVPEEAEA